MNSIKFLYLGEDQEFVKHMQGNLDQFYGDLKIKIETKSLKSMKEARDFIFNKDSQSYHLFIVDFSNNFPIYVFVARTLGLQNNYKTIPLMGLTGPENRDDHFLAGIFSGCKAIFVKGIEYSSTVNFSVQLYNPKLVRPVKWPSGEFAEEVIDCFAGFKINYFTKDYIHAETNLSLPINEEIILNTSIANNAGAMKFKVIKENNTNYYYNLNRIYDLEILPPSKRIEENLGIIDPQKREPPDKVEGKALEIFATLKNKIENWIDGNLDKSTPKSTKIVIIDKDLSILKQMDKNPDEYFFVMVTHRFFSPNFDTIRKIRPDILVMVLDDSTPGDKKNTLEILPEVIAKIKEFPEYHPFIILLNCPQHAKELQDRLKYAKVLSFAKNVDFALLKNIIDQFEAFRKKIETPEFLKNQPGREKRFYLNKEKKDSFGYHPFKIKIVAINETTINFKTTYILDDYMVLKLEFPSKFWITVLPGPKVEGYLRTYVGIINGIGELEKNQLRVYINKVFVPKEPEENKNPKAA